MLRFGPRKGTVLGLIRVRGARLPSFLYKTSLSERQQKYTNLLDRSPEHTGALLWPGGTLQPPWPLSLPDFFDHKPGVIFKSDALGPLALLISLIDLCPVDELFWRICNVFSWLLKIICLPKQTHLCYRNKSFFPGKLGHWSSLEHSIPSRNDVGRKIEQGTESSEKSSSVVLYC